MAKTLVKVKLLGGKRLRKRLAKMDPQQNARILIKSYREIALKISANARNVQIRRGRGAVHPTKLTHRSFRLRDSIVPDFKGLPRFAEVGTNLFYGAIHEFGLGRFPARPFMEPALDAISPTIPVIVTKHWKREAGL